LPIINDSLYGGMVFGNAFLALRASSLSFNDPSSGEGLSYSIPQLELSEIL
jgi:23S rRNA-/tRNA-specific pseudouridylate synthase